MPNCTLQRDYNMSSNYRYNTVHEYATTLKSLQRVYFIKMKKYRRRITIIDITVYSISGVLAGTGIILSSVIMIAPIVVPAVISTVATISGVITAITKKISSCCTAKFQAYSSAYTAASNGYLQLSTLISNAIDDEIITDAEFTAMSTLYNTVMSSLKKDFPLKTQNNNNNDNVIDVNRVTSTDHI